MYELIQLTESDYYFDCPAKIGLVRTCGNDVVLIDSGNDKDAGKKVLRVLNENGWNLTAIFNTHSHADHIGGNKFLQERTGCRIYAAGMERAYTNLPYLEPVGLYGGRPFKDLKHKFLMAQESDALPVTGDVLPVGMSIIELPGHSFDMVGFLTADGTAYIADSVSSEATLSKYGIGYLWDAEQSLSTLQFLKTIEANRFVPAHADVTEDIKPLADINISAIEGVKGKLLEICREPKCFEDILKEIFDAYEMTMNAQQYALIGSTVRSYLAGLYDGGLVAVEFAGNKMLWKKC